MKRRGFTLLEVVTVLGVITICTSIAVFMMTRNREVITVERASALLRARVERAQSLASVAGSRMGTTRLITPAPCPAGPGTYLWVEVNPGAGTATIPSGVTYNPGTDTMTVTCEVVTIAQETNNLGQIDSVAVTFAFSSEGRVILPNAPSGSVFISLRQVGAHRRFGFRVLPSGVICAASDAVQLRCDEEVT